MPETAKALVVLAKYGEFVVQDVPVPKPGAGEILIKILATALNPIDWKIHKLGLFFEDYPAILGYDIAGEVAEVGEGVADFATGEKVFGQAHFDPKRGSFQQYILAYASNTAKIPPNITVDEAATIPVVLSCAYVGLYNTGTEGLGITTPVSEGGRGKYAGVPILITGGPSSVGQLVLQLARLSGFSPIITTASPKHTALLKSLGATDIIDRTLRPDAIVAEVKRLLKGKPLHYIFDAISAEETQRFSLDVLAEGGKIVVTLPPITASTAAKTLMHVFGAARHPPNIPLLESLYHDHLFGLVEKGDIKPNKVEYLPGGLAGIPAGLAKLEADQVSGAKLVSHPHETN